MTAIRAVCEHQLMSEMEGTRWMSEMLHEGVKHGDLLRFDVTSSNYGKYGLQLVTFTVDFPMGEGLRFNPKQSYEEAAATATDLLNEIIHDTDVQVRWISVVMD